jgi:hypothetical protein
MKSTTLCPIPAELAGMGDPLEHRKLVLIPDQ